MSKKKVLILVLTLAFLVAGASVLYQKLADSDMPGATVNNAQGEAQAEKKHQMPDFTVYQADGSAVKLSDFRGKPVVLNFWASWCGPCKNEMPDFDAKAAEMDGEVVFMMVNMTDGYQETVDTASKFIEEQEYTFPVYYDTDLDAATTYGVASVPTTYFIDAEGYGIARAMGAIGSADLQKGIEMIYEN